MAASRCRKTGGWRGQTRVGLERQDAAVSASEYGKCPRLCHHLPYCMGLLLLRHSLQEKTDISSSPKAIVKSRLSGGLRSRLVRLPSSAPAALTEGFPIGTQRPGSRAQALGAAPDRAAVPPREMRPASAFPFSPRGTSVGSQLGPGMGSKGFPSSDSMSHPEPPSPGLRDRSQKGQAGMDGAL